nr:uncharacterized mitochondrial protein AtMg00810-like [Tanacetum cinerariifolium]
MPAIPKADHFKGPRKLFDSCTNKVKSEPPHGSNVDISKIHECKQTLDLSAGTSINVSKEQNLNASAGILWNVNEENLKTMASDQLSFDPAPECQTMASDQNNSDPAPEFPTLAPTVISSENINQAETHAENDQVADDEFINIFSTPVQDQGETSSRHALYGLKEAPREWYDELSKFLLSKGFSKGFYKDTYLSGTPVDQTKYHSKVGAIMYLTASRPDIMHATCYCARYQAKPTEKHLTAVKRIFRYLKDTIHMGLWYPKDTGFELTAFLDSDHAGCLDSRKSTSGGIQFLGGDKLVSWSSKKQDCTSMSFTEAETMSSPDHSTSNNEDAFSSNISDYVSTISDYSPDFVPSEEISPKDTETFVSPSSLVGSSSPIRNLEPKEIPVAKRGIYKEFISFQPFYFNGTEGAIGLIRWFKRTESVFSRSKCAKEDRVTFAIGTLTNDALSRWNAYAQPIGIEQDNKITWTELKRLLTNKYYPRNEIKKMEDEFYDLTVKGNDLKTYIRRFQELASLCPNMVPNTAKLMEAFIGGLPRSIEGTLLLHNLKLSRKLST